MPEIDARILAHSNTILDDYQARIEEYQSASGQSLPITRSNGQLLVVEDGYPHVAGYISSHGPKVPASEAYLYLTGQAARGTVSIAYVRFVPKAKILRPKFSLPNRLDVYIDERHITQATAQLDRPPRYVSYAEYSTGHIYCDFTGFD